MRRMILLAMLCIVFISLLFHRLYVSDHLNFALINLALLFIAPIGYFSSLAIVHAILALSWVVFCPILLIGYKIDLVNAALPILVFNGLIIGMYKCRQGIEDTKDALNSILTSVEETHRALSEEFEKSDNFIQELLQKEIMIANLYEVTKRMSGSLTFPEIFNVFSIFLKENFYFKKSVLLTVKQKDGDMRIEKVYKVWQEEDYPSQLSAADYGDAIKLFSEKKEPVYLDREKDAVMFEKLHLPTDVKTFAAVPLSSEKKIVGVLIVESLAGADFEKFVIVAMQFALEIKKVLLYETVEELAITDGLTGLYVRRYFLERFKEELIRSRRYTLTFSFLMVDIDNFKKCNDTYGHLVGDVVLKDVAHIIKDNVREIDLVARYGGEEFALLLPETGHEGAHLAAERIRKKIEEHVFKAYDEKPKITISIGLAVYLDHSESAEDIIEKADQALYEAKQSGKNIVCEYKT